jgi:molybdopterin-guanine dinucleotide biosynthesis protein A
MSESRGVRDAAGHSRDGALVGVVLCGGRSQRFGSDKALARVDGTTLLERTLGVLAQSCGRVLAATGATARYAAELARHPKVEVVLDRAPDLGPLGGLEAALAATGPGETHLLTVACDLPNLDTGVLGALVERARTSGADAVLWRDAGGVHPLLACYRVSVLGAVRAALARGERRLVSFHGGFAAPADESPAVRPLAVAYLEAGALPGADSGRDPAANANSPHDLAQTRARVPHARPVRSDRSQP